MTEPTRYQESRQCVYQVDRHDDRTPALCSRCRAKSLRRPVRLVTGETFQADEADRS